MRKLVPDKVVEEIDAGGLYACLTRYELYAKHEFEPYEDVLGPDFRYGIWLRRQGYQKLHRLGRSGRAPEAGRDEHPPPEPPRPSR